MSPERSEGRLPSATCTGDTADISTSRNQQRQEEQLAAFSQPPLTSAEVDEIAQAGRGKFHREFMKDVWDAAKE